MPSRVIRGQILASNSLGNVSVGAEMLFWRLLIAADDFGRLDGRLSVLRAAVYPARNVTLDELQDWLGELEKADSPQDGTPGPQDGPVVRYQVDGQPFIALRNWDRLRSNGRRARDSRFPAPPSDIRGSPRSSAEILGDPPERRETGVEEAGDESRDSGSEKRETGGGGPGEEGARGHEPRAGGLGLLSGPAAALAGVESKGDLAAAQRRLETRRRRVQYGGGT